MPREPLTSGPRGVQTVITLPSRPLAKSRSVDLRAGYTRCVTAAEHFNLVVIGSGPAGEKGAAQAAYFGNTVALIEQAPRVGGACVHTGTLPSKTLREAALYLTGFRKRELYGMTLDLDREASLHALMGRLRAVTDGQVSQIARNFERHHIQVFTGAAEFQSEHELVVHAADGSTDRTLTADVVLIATGSSPLHPPGVPFDDADVEDSDTILNLDRIPDALAVVGGGVIGCEYACIFASLGTRISIIEGRDSLMGFLDHEMSDTLRQILERDGHSVDLGDAVSSIERIPHGQLRLRLKSGRELLVDKVLYSAGRAGNTSHLGLTRAGVATDPKGRILVNDHFQTSMPHVYAAGDVIGNPALASVSMEQGRVAMCHAFNIPFKTKVADLMPFGIYTIPEISMVGATEADLTKGGIAFEVGRARHSNNARGQITGEQDGLLKLLFEISSKRLLGVHIIGAGATELIHIGQMVMHAGGTIDVFIDSVLNFPTLAELYKYAAYDGLGRLAQRGTPSNAAVAQP
jgi:NAD(P) transhydrogenase